MCFHCFFLFSDDDMQSTFSADVGGEDNKLVFADEDEEEIDEDDLDEAATLGQKLVLLISIISCCKLLSVYMIIFTISQSYSKHDK